MKEIWLEHGVSTTPRCILSRSKKNCRSHDKERRAHPPAPTSFCRCSNASPFVRPPECLPFHPTCVARAAESRGRIKAGSKALLLGGANRPRFRRGGDTDHSSGRGQPGRRAASCPILKQTRAGAAACLICHFKRRFGVGIISPRGPSVS